MAELIAFVVGEDADLSLIGGEVDQQMWRILLMI